MKSNFLLFALLSFIGAKIILADDTPSSLAAKIEQEQWQPPQQASTAIKAVDDKTAVDVDDDKTSPLSFFSKNSIVSDNAKDVDLEDSPVRDRDGNLKELSSVNKPPSSSLRGAAVGGGEEEEEETGDVFENAVNGQEPEESEEDFTPQHPFLSSDEAMTNNNVCATVSYKPNWDNYKEQWRTTQKAQPDPSLGYSCVGVGPCEDANGKYHNSVVFRSIPSQAACAVKCSLIKNDAFRGFSYTSNYACGCDFDNGKAPKNVQGAFRSYTGYRYPGKGEIAGTSGWVNEVCFKYTPTVCETAKKFTEGQRDPPSYRDGFSCVGLGKCLDGYNAPYGALVYRGIPSATICTNACSSHTFQNKYVGIEYTNSGTCKCLYDRYDKVPSNVPGTTVSFGYGGGPITKADGTDNVMCYMHCWTKGTHCNKFSTCNNCCNGYTWEWVYKCT